MKKRILVLLGILIIGGAGAGVCWKLGFFDRQEESKDMAYVTEISQLLGQVSGVTNRYAGVVEPRETVEVELEKRPRCQRSEGKDRRRSEAGAASF